MARLEQDSWAKDGRPRPIASPLETLALPGFVSAVTKGLRAVFAGCMEGLFGP
jgi:hypothetical protein